MLRELQIQNLAIIDDLRLEFTHGLNILSGETGAGKSIILNSIYLILGARSDVDMIRAGEEKGVVEALFDIQSNSDVPLRLEKSGIEYDLHDPLVIRRVISRSGKNKVFINGQLANVTILQDITRGLVDISSQHEFHKLMNPSFHVQLLDHFGGLEDERSRYSDKVEELRELLKQIQSLTVNEAERTRQIDFLNYQLKEIQDLNPQPDEDQTLEKEITKQRSVKERIDFIQASLQSLSESDGSVLERLGLLTDQCTDMTGIDEAFEPIRRALESALIQVEEANQELGRLSGKIECDDTQLETLSERLSELKKLMRKYGPTIQHVHEYRNQMEDKLSQLMDRDESVKMLQQQLETVRGEALEMGLQLAQKRKRLAKIFKEGVEDELKEMGLEHCQLVPVFEDMEGDRKFGPNGIESVHFDVSMNPGEPPKSLARFTSGGELSRILLAMKNIVAGKGEIGVYLFDEVDAGIGGKVAVQVGQKLASVAQFNQVICITHLPQVACFADRHFRVYKTVLDGRTTTRIEPLDLDAQTHEIIRMIGGDELGESALLHAEELLRMAQQKRMSMRQRDLNHVPFPT